MRIKLQEMRKRAGFKSAREFAVYFGINVNTYTNYEQGKSNIPIDLACRFADALGCTLDELAGREPRPTDLTPDELRMIGIYRTADERGKQVIDAVIDTQKTSDNIKSSLATRRAVV